MKSLKFILVITFFLTFSMPESFCQTAKKLTKKGVELAVNGMNKEAADYYYRALLKRADYIDAENEEPGRDATGDHQEPGDKDCQWDLRSV